MKYVTTVMKVAIHPEGKNPAYDDGVTYVEVVDHAAGAFIEISQGEMKIEIDPEELDLIITQAKQLIAGFPDES
jgi:hypothetical protein